LGVLLVLSNAEINSHFHDGSCTIHNMAAIAVKEITHQQSRVIMQKSVPGQLFHANVCKFNLSKTENIYLRSPNVLCSCWIQGRQRDSFSGN